jgi:DNA-binding transcriptional regulator YiaG
MIIAQKELLKRKNFIEEVKNYLLTGKVPKGCGINVTAQHLCFEDVDSDECNIMCELREGYAEVVTLAELRKAQNLTQQQVADALDIKYQYVQLWERGERRPGTMYLTKLAKLYKVPIEMLLKL